jgi:hypothetical protein
MFIQIAPKARVYVSEVDVEFIKQHSRGAFKSTDLSPRDAERAKVLADKAVFVRKKHDMTLKNRSELVKQIEAYGLKNKLADLVRKQEARRPFRHLPKQFSKGILIGNIAIVPKKSTGTRYVYVIADMLEAKVLHDNINLKQTAIMVAHHLADEKSLPTNILELDTKFASQLFDIQNAKRMIKEAQRSKDQLTEDVYWDRLDVANHLADECKENIQAIFNDTFGA